MKNDSEELIFFFFGIFLTINFSIYFVLQGLFAIEFDLHTRAAPDSPVLTHYRPPVTCTELGTVPYIFWQHCYPHDCNPRKQSDF